MNLGSEFGSEICFLVLREQTSHICVVYLNRYIFIAFHVDSSDQCKSFAPMPELEWTRTRIMSGCGMGKCKGRRISKRKRWSPSEEALYSIHFGEPLAQHSTEVEARSAPAEDRIIFLRSLKRIFDISVVF